MSWFAMPAGPRGAKLAALVAGSAFAYFATLWLVGFRLRDYSRHER
jgi:putative peptidoglycan lipid II flippase